MPKTRFLKDCDNWHKSQLAEAQDAHLLSMAVLRRDLVRLPIFCPYPIRVLFFFAVSNESVFFLSS